MSNHCDCGSSCELCKECGEPKCECYCSYDEEYEESSYKEDDDDDEW